MAENVVNPWIAAGTEVGKGILGNLAADVRAKKQREWSEKMMDKQNDWSLMMWNKTNEYNSPINQIARLENAGLNPLYYGLDGSSANALESAAPLNYERASDTINLGNPVDAYQSTASFNKQLEVMEAQKKDLEASANLKNSQKSGNDLDNEWKEKTMEARVKAEDLKNSVSEEQIKVFQAEVKKIDQDIKESAERTANEIVKRALYKAQEELTKSQKYKTDAEARRIFALLPYEQNFLAAQTENQQMQAASAYTHALYEAGLIDSGYIDAITDKAKAEAKDANERALIDAWKRSVKDGTVFDDYKRYGIKENDKAGRALLRGLNYVVSSTSALVEGFGPILTIAGSVAGGAIAGARTVPTF